jgi:hypothetical protein
MEDMVEKDRFYNIFHQLEAKQKAQVIISSALAISLAICVFSFVIYAISPKPVYYINGTSGLAMPLADYSPIAEEYAKLFVANITNFTGENVKDVFESAKKMCSASYLAKIRPVLNNEVASAEKSRMNSSSSILSAETKKINQDLYEVNIKVFRTIWIGQEKVSEKLFYYKVNVKKVSPNASNPIGLVIDNVQVSESSV